MKQETIITLVAVLAAAGVGYYLYQKSKAVVPTAATTGGGTGANASTSSAFNGVINPTTIAGGISVLKGLGGDLGILSGGTGGATLNGGSDGNSGDAEFGGYN